MAITSIFMQTWKTKDIPSKWKKSQEAIMKLYPNSEYYLLTDEDIRNFVIQYFPQYLELHDSLEKPIMRADLIRYMWLYVNGGVYIDLDVEITKKLDFLEVDNGIFLPQVKSCYSNWFMASEKNNDFWLICLDEIMKRNKERPFYIKMSLIPLYVTGPYMINYVVKHRYHGVVNTLPAHYFYMKDLGGSSWVSTPFLILKQIAGEIEIILIFLLFLFIAYILLNNVRCS